MLLALPLFVFGVNHFVGVFELPEAPDSAGGALLQSMHDGGLMAAVAASHVVIALLLFAPRTRFAGAVLQLPMSLGILAFHYTMLPDGLIVAGVMLALNLLAMADRDRLADLFERMGP